MSAISDFISAQSTFNDQMNMSISSIMSEMSALNASMEQLKNSSNLSAEDQASLDALKVSGQAVVDKLSAMVPVAQQGV